MLRRMTDMPAGTIGFEAIGEVEDDDWERAVEPVLRDEMADGRKIRLLYLLGPEARERRRKASPLGTEGTGWDVGWGAVYLASDESRWVTGQVLVIDAGLTVTTR